MRAVYFWFAVVTYTIMGNYHCVYLVSPRETILQLYWIWILELLALVRMEMNHALLLKMLMPLSCIRA